MRLRIAVVSALPYTNVDMLMILATLRRHAGSAPPSPPPPFRPVPAFGFVPCVAAAAAAPNAPTGK